ncbi:hypothetical protein TSUD_153730 [Trifolium subterraneum]|uniref:Uncharacterized protein n=1 Tax=Trifolium subterraneum TaxID=3900 RepID=A0A2Z6NH06_TRISU|nr:hypothetical protein TSUD_153730 [Trifolium subterraneum]
MATGLHLFWTRPKPTSTSSWTHLGVEASSSWSAGLTTYSSYTDHKKGALILPVRIFILKILGSSNTT